MSFLELEDDSLATLQEALAFIDACDDQEDDDSACSTGGSSTPNTTACSTTSSDDNAPAASLQDTSLKIFIRRTPSGKLLSQPTAQQQISQEQEQFGLPQQQQPVAKPSGMNNNRAKSVKKHRERKKNEMLTLRDQVAHLEATLAHLKRIVPHSIGRLEAANEARTGTGGGRTSLHLLLEARIASLSTDESERNEAKSAYRALLALQPSGRGATNTICKTASSSTPSWFDVAATQARERYASEALNLQLKEALQAQMQMAQALESILGRTRAEGLDLLLDYQRDELMLHIDDPLKKPSPPAGSVAEPLNVMDQLYAGMHQMYISIESVIGKQCEADWAGAISSSSRVKQKDVRTGMCIELASTAQLYCAFQEAGRVMWQRMNQNKLTSKDLGKPSMERRELTSDSFVISYPLVLGILSGNDNQPLTLQCSSYMCKFDESNRFMVMWYSIVNLPNSELTFTEKGWIVATPNLNPAVAAANAKPETESPPPSTIIKMCHRVSSAPQGSQVTEETKDLVAVVLRTLSRKTREYHQLMQDLLLDQFSSASTAQQSRALPMV